MSIAEAEEFSQKLAQWRLAEAYEEIGQRVAHIGARDILSYYGHDTVRAVAAFVQRLHVQEQQFAVVGADAERRPQS
ncbi:hypothetical protein PJM29_32540, partial [Mycobacterium kansasii]